MGRSAASIQTEITAIEAELAKIVHSQSYAINGRSKTNQQYDVLSKRLDLLYMQLDRVSGSAPMFVRGRVRCL